MKKNNKFIGLALLVPVLAIAAYVDYTQLQKATQSEAAELQHQKDEITRPLHEMTSRMRKLERDLARQGLGQSPDYGELPLTMLYCRLLDTTGLPLAIVDISWQASNNYYIHRIRGSGKAEASDKSPGYFHVEGQLQTPSATKAEAYLQRYVQRLKKNLAAVHRAEIYTKLAPDHLGTPKKFTMLIALQTAPKDSKNTRQK